MADHPQAAPARPRPLSPHMTIYRWPITMAASITHRATGIALSAGTLYVAWWLVAASSGPESGAFQLFAWLTSTLVGQFILFGFVWSLAYHLLSGIRHLAWDLGFGFGLRAANAFSYVIYALSLIVAASAFALVYAGVQQFWRLRVSGAALGILSIWFAYVALGLVGAGQVPVLAFLQHPINSVLMGSFMLLSSYHMALGLREVVEDYVHTNGTKIFLLLMIRLLAFASAIASVVALLRITIA